MNQSTTPPRIRRAQPTDLEALVALEDRSFDSDRMSRAQYRRHLDSDSALVLVATAPGELLGSAVLFFRRNSTVSRLYSLTTRPESRGQGIGTALIEAAHHAARRRGCRALRLEVRVDNVSTISLYERLGYRKLAALKRYYQDGVDGWRYELLLKKHHPASK